MAEAAPAPEPNAPILSADPPAPPPAPEPAKSAGETLYPAEGNGLPAEGKTLDDPGLGGEEKPTEEVKPVEEAKPAEEKPAEEVKPLTAADYDIKFPEAVKVDDALLTKFKEASVEGKVAPEVAQKYADMYVQALTDQNAALTAQWEGVKAEWAKQINEMPEFQGERAAQSTAVLGTLIEEFGDNDVREYFKLAGDNPAVVKMFLKIGSTLIEGSPTTPGNPLGDRRTNRSLGERLGYTTPPQ